MIIVKETFTYPWLGISLWSRIAGSSSATLFNDSLLFPFLCFFFPLDLFLWKMISIFLWALFLSENLPMISNQLQLEEVYELWGLAAYLHFLFYATVNSCRNCYEGNEHSSVWNDYTCAACYILTRSINLVVSPPLDWIALTFHWTWS